MKGNYEIIADLEGYIVTNRVVGFDWLDKSLRACRFRWRIKGSKIEKELSRAPESYNSG